MNHSYDIIGDIHGRYDALLELLGKLGYEMQADQWSAPKGRTLISVGDVLNKGPRPLDCLSLIANLVRSNQAHMIIGNHEINALHYLEGLRPITPATTRQFEPTLSLIQEDPEAWQKHRSFLAQLPTRLSLANDQLRVVHAHWPDNDFPWMMSDEFIQDSGQEGPLADALQRMVKGPEEASEPYVDKKGVTRETDRVTWWDNYPEDAPFIAFGHYCFPWPHKKSVPSEPTFLGPGRNAVCLDFGAGNADRLVALRWPEREFVTVKVSD